MKDIRTDFLRRRFVIDGGLGTELEDRIDRNDAIHPNNSRLWSGKVLIERPELIQTVHKDYIDVGADIIISSSYQLSYSSLAKYGNLNNEQIDTLWRKSIDVAENAIQSCNVNRPIYLVGSIGPYGGFLSNGSEYTGDYGVVTGEQLQNFFLPLVEYFNNEPRVDIIGFETVANYKEFKTIINVMKRFPRKPFYVSCNFVNDNKLPDGTSVEKVIAYLAKKLQTLELNFLGLGINCVDYLKVESILQQIPSWVPVLIYPNLGYKYDETSKSYKVDRDNTKWQQTVKKWLTHENVRAVGGCCSTTPETISLVAQEITKI